MSFGFLLLGKNIWYTEYTMHRCWGQCLDQREGKLQSGLKILHNVEFIIYTLHQTLSDWSNQEGWDGLHLQLACGRWSVHTFCVVLSSHGYCYQSMLTWLTNEFICTNLKEVVTECSALWWPSYTHNFDKSVFSYVLATDKSTRSTRAHESRDSYSSDTPTIWERGVCLTFTFWIIFF